MSVDALAELPAGLTDSFPEDRHKNPIWPPANVALKYKRELRKCGLPTFRRWNDERPSQFDLIFRALPSAFMVMVTSVGVESCFSTARQVRTDSRTGLSFENLSFLTCAAFNKITFAGPPKRLWNQGKSIRNPEEDKVLKERFVKRARTASAAAGEWGIQGNIFHYITCPQTLGIRIYL